MTVLDQLINIRAQHPMMTISGLVLLVHLDRNGPVTNYAACSQTLKTPGRSIICRAAEALEGYGLITRDKNPLDGRYRILTITEKGRKLMEGME